MDIHTDHGSDLNVLLLQDIHTFCSLILLNALSDHLVYPRWLWCAPLEVLLSPTQCFLLLLRYFFFPCPSTFLLHLLKILNPRTWKKFTIYDLQVPHPHDLLHTRVYMELAFFSPHQHALFWEPMLSKTDFSVENKCSFQVCHGHGHRGTQIYSKQIHINNSLVSCRFVSCTNAHKLSQSCWWDFCLHTMLPLKFWPLYLLPHFLLVIINQHFF